MGILTPLVLHNSTIEEGTPSKGRLGGVFLRTSQVGDGLRTFLADDDPVPLPEWRQLVIGEVAP